jgi:hypothetical protein
VTTESRAVPEVIVDFTFDRGILQIAVANVSDYSAFAVTVSFDTPFHGLGGSVEVSSLALFRRLEFLAPHKRIETLLDSSAEYFARREPTHIGATVSYNDGEGNNFERRITHDLAIYRDVSYLVNTPSPPTPTRRVDAHASDARVTDVGARDPHSARTRLSPPTGNVPHGNRPS